MKGVILRPIYKFIYSENLIFRDSEERMKTIFYFQRLALFSVFFAATMMLAATYGFAASGPQKYIGFWRPGVGESKVVQFDTWEEFTESWEDLSKKGLRLQDLEIVKGNDEIIYTATYVRGNNKYALLAYDNFDDFAENYKEMLDDKQMQLIDVEVVPSGGKNFYVGVWDAGTGGSAMYMYNNWGSFIDQWNTLAKQNRVLIDIEAFESQGKVWYVGVWQNGKGGEQRLYNTDSFSEFDTKFREFSKDDLRLIDVDIVRNGGVKKYVGVWNKGNGGQYFGVFDTVSQVKNKNTELNGIKLDLIDIAMIEDPLPKPKPTPAPQGKPAKKPGDALDFNADGPKKKDPTTGIEFPANMPAIVFPNFEGCNASDRAVVEKAWAMAHHAAWRSVQLFRHLDNAGDKRDDLWAFGYVNYSNKDDYMAKNFSPKAWFGSYEGGTYRYDYIRDAVFMNWESRFQKKMTYKCRRNDSGAHPCYLENPGTNRPPSANHIVNGTVNVCNRFFDDKSPDDQIRTVLHEHFHWLAPKGLAILDTHTHWDRNSKGRCRATTEKGYGYEAIHFAQSDGCWNDTKWHKGDAARNNDNYAYMIRNLGAAVYSGRLKKFGD